MRIGAFDWPEDAGQNVTKFVLFVQFHFRVNALLPDMPLFRTLGGKKTVTTLFFIFNVTLLQETHFETFFEFFPKFGVK